MDSAHYYYIVTCSSSSRHEDCMAAACLRAFLFLRFSLPFRLLPRYGRKISRNNSFSNPPAYALSLRNIFPGFFVYLLSSSRLANFRTGSPVRAVSRRSTIFTCASHTSFEYVRQLALSPAYSVRAPARLTLLHSSMVSGTGVISITEHKFCHAPRSLSVPNMKLNCCARASLKSTRAVKNSVEFSSH